MSEPTNTTPIEDRLADYGGVLRAHLAGEQDDPGGAVLIGTFGATATAATTKRTPGAAVLTMAAAVVAVLALLLPTLLLDSTDEPITVTGGDVAAQPPAPDTGEERDTPNASSADEGGAEDNDKTADGEQGVDEPELADKANDEQELGDEFALATGNADTTDADTTEEGDDGRSLDDDSERGDKDEANAGEKEDERSTSTALLEAADDDNQEQAEQSDDQDADPAAECPSGAESRDYGCVIVGPPPAATDQECPDDAVELGDECYLVVPPTCGDLELAPSGDGCLKLIGSAGESGTCPANYQLDGAQCVKLLEAQFSCAQGTPADGACLLKYEAEFVDGGCSGEQLQIGDGCYQLSDPEFDCGAMTDLGNGTCRYAVTTESSSACPDGYEPLSSETCFRYEDGPTVDCGDGVHIGGEWCKYTIAGTPGPDQCDDGVLQDAQGCYVLFEADAESGCGEYTAVEGGMCRKDKPSYPTWTCSNGSTVGEPTCVIEEASAVITCAIGELVDAGTCKSLADKVVSEGCPDWALEDAAGCFKIKEPAISCGGLDVAPDGVSCKQWIDNAGAGTAGCESGYELVGQYCKKYVDGVASCAASGAPVEVDGIAKCRFTQTAGEAASGCSTGEIEKAGNCYELVAASCADLDRDLYGNGCKKIVGEAGTFACETGFTLVNDECVKKL